MARKPRKLWQDEPANRVAQAVIGRGRAILADYSDRYQHIARMYRMYASGSQTTGTNRLQRQFRRNAAARACDDFSSEVAGNPPALDVTLRDRGFEAKEQARWYQWYQDAAYDKQHMPQLYLRCCKDSWIAGFGFGLCRDYDDGPMLERVHPSNVLLDDAGCDGGVEPPELVIQHVTPRHVLMDEHPDRAAKIEEMAPSVSGMKGRDVVMCMEAWYADKRHVLACEGVDQALIDESWEGRWPGAYLVLLEDERGLWGLSLMDRIASMQIARNYAGRTIQRGLRWTVPHIFAPDNLIDQDELTDDSKLVVRTKGDPRQAVVVTQPVAAPELFAREEWLDNRIRDDGLATELFAGGIQGDDSTSGKHLREKRDMGVRKLLPQHRAIAEFGKQLLLELVRGEGRVADANPDYRINVKVSGITKNIIPSMIELDVGSIQVEAKPASALPLEASARLDVLTDLYDLQLIDAEEFHANADIIEFEKSRRRKTSIVDLIDLYIEDIVYDGKLRLPRELLIKLAGDRMLREGTLALARAEIDYRDDLENGGEERQAELRDRLAKLEKWLAYISKTLKRIKEEEMAPPPRPAPPAEAMGVPVPGMPPPPGPNGAPMGPPAGPPLAPTGNNVIALPPRA